MKKTMLRLFCLTLTLCLTLALALPASAGAYTHHHEGSYSSYIYVTDAAWTSAYFETKIGSTSPANLTAYATYIKTDGNNHDSPLCDEPSLQKPYSTGFDKVLSGMVFKYLMFSYTIGTATVHSYCAIDNR